MPKFSLAGLAVFIILVAVTIAIIAYVMENGSNPVGPSTSIPEIFVYRTVCSEDILVNLQCDYITDGTADQTEINTAFDDLTTGRTWQETVYLIGSFEVNAAILIPAYTVFDIRQASIRLANGANVDGFISNLNFSSDGAVGDDDGDILITILGGIVDGNKANQNGVAKFGVLMSRTDDLLIDGLFIKDVDGTGLQVRGRVSEGAERTRGARINNVTSQDATKKNISIQNALRDINVNNLYSNGGDEVGVFIGHSDGNYNNVFVYNAGTYGVQINNIHSVQMNNLKVLLTGQHCVYVLGFVSSNATNWHLEGCSQETAQTYDAMFFSSDDSLSYGVTADSAFTSITIRGDQGDSPNGQLRYGVYFEDDTGAGSQYPNQNISFANLVIQEGTVQTGEIRFPAVAGTLKILFSDEDNKSLALAIGAPVRFRNTNSGETMTFDDYIITSNPPTGGLTHTLISASNAGGREMTFIKTDPQVGDTLTIDANGVETINGQLTCVLNAENESIRIYSDGTEWYVTGGNGWTCP